MDELSKYLDDMTDGLEMLEDYEAEEMLESLENYAMKRGDRKLRAKVNQMKRSRGISSMNRGKGFGLAQKGNPMGVKGKLAAQFTIKIERVTANIAQPLPFALFGALDLTSGYLRVLSDLIPAGVTLNYVAVGRQNADNTNALRADFSYTEGINTDIVRVTCQQVPYPNLLEAINSDDFRISQIRYSISDVAQLSQFTNDVQIVQRSIFGKSVNDSLTPDSFKAPEQFQNGIIDLLGVVWDVTKELSIASLINSSAGFSISLNCFVEKVAKSVTL